LRSTIAKHLVPANQDPLLVLICWAVGVTALLEILPAVLLWSFFDAYMGAVLGAYAIGLVLAFRLPRRDGGWDRPRWIAALGLMAVCVALAPLMPRQAGLGIAPLIGFAVLLPALGGRRTRIGTLITLLVVVVTSILQDRPAADVDSLLASIVRSTGVAMAAQMLLFILWRQRKDIVDALQRYASLYGGVPIGLFRATPEGSFAEANDAFVAMLGFRDRAALLGTPVEQVFQESGERGQVFAELYGRGESIVELVARRADGREIWTRLHVRALCDAAGRPVAFEGSAEDTTVERAARDMEARLASIVESADDSIFAMSLDGRITNWNAGAARMFGYAAAEVVGESIERLVPSEKHADLEADLARIGAGQRLREPQTELTAKDGKRVAVSISISPILSLDGTVVGASAIARDLTEQHRLETELYRQTFYDALTGLPNRRMAIDTLRHALDAVNGNGHEMGFVLLDLDAFTSTNDTYGHAVGDQVLVEVGNRIRRSVRPGDLVARMGNDAFAVILDEIRSPSAALASAELLLEALREPMRIGQLLLTVSATVGVVTTAETAFDAPEELLAAAEFAVEAAPTRGSQRIAVFEGRMRDEALSRVRLEADIKIGIERNEFEPYYQPIVDVRTGQITGVEALARWRHKARGLLGPDEFIPIAERSDLIVALGTAILRRAAEEVLAWSQPWHTLNVNVSAVQFAQPTFVDVVRQVLHETGFPADRLKLELTESVMMNDAADAMVKFAEIRALGVRTVMDDFGTGYSSLQYLRDLELDGIKIDRSFIADLGPGSRNRPVVEAAVALGKALGLEVTAEGIETEIQLAELRRIGCDLGQGFLFARPEPAQAMRIRLADQSLGVAV
jgi:diguanylate cyclase (GGDEF)-like protein/PAS domain S-box-containing protein